MLEFIKYISRKLLGERDEVLNTGPLPGYDELVEIARKDLQAAQSLFNHVIEQDLIDYAIFKMNAAERRYIFLLHEAQSRQTKIEQRIDGEKKQTEDAKCCHSN